MKLRTYAAATAAAAAALAVVTATPAQALSVTGDYQQHKNKLSGYVHVKIDGKKAGTVTWNADPGDWDVNYLGDSLYVRDSRSDGYAIQGEAIVLSTGEGINVSTSGKTAPVEVRKTRNLPEGTKIRFRGCVVKKGVKYGCTPLYDGKA
ncbi:hypothetical protein [Streptomyces sp. AD55]|uniref:hypothetical protein n=1 Tax=Streptomyces sp. AD55 TaxID=3242895 RepID=UPI003528F8A4